MTQDINEISFIVLDLTIRLQKASKALAETVEGMKGNTDHLEVIRSLAQVGEIYDQHNEMKKRINTAYDLLSRDIVPEAMRHNKVKTVTVEGIGRVTISHRYSCSMLDKEKAMDWLRGNGLEGIIIETVNSSTLSATAKDMLLNEGKEMPPELFKTGTSPFTSITKA
jgi:hypothetical protein